MLSSPLSLDKKQHRSIQQLDLLTNIYPYCLRIALLSTPPSSPASASPNSSPPSLTPSPHSLADFNSLFRDLIAPATTPSKLPKLLLPALQKRASLLLLSNSPTLDNDINNIHNNGIEHDPLFLRSLASFQKTCLSRKERCHELRATGKIEDLIVAFVQTVSFLIRTVPPPTNSSLCAPTYRPNVRIYHSTGRFIELLKETLLKDCPSHSTKILHNLERYQQLMNTPSENTRRWSKGSSLDHWVRILFNVSQIKLDRDAYDLRRICTQQAAIDDLKQCLNQLERNCYMVAKPEDFETDRAYETWKSKEKASITQLIHEISTKPNFAIRQPSPANTRNSFLNTAEYLYTFVPPDPRAWYCYLLTVCVQHDIVNADALALSQNSTDLLNQAIDQWRVPTGFCAIAMLKEMEGRFRAGLVQITQVTQAFVMLEKSVQISDPDEWPLCDRHYLLTTFDAIEKLLVAELSAALDNLDRLGDKTSLDTLEPLPRLIGLIYDNNIWRGAAGETDDNSVRRAGKIEWTIGHLTDTIKVLSNTRYHAINDKAAHLSSTGVNNDGVSNSGDLSDVARLITLADLIVEDSREFMKRFPAPILRHVDLPALMIETYLKYFVLEMENMVAVVGALAKDGRETAGIERVMTLYRGVAEMANIKEQLGGGMRFVENFNLEAWFSPYVQGWLERTLEKTPQWVASAIQHDKFSSVSSDGPYSSSVVDLFAIMHEEMDFIQRLNWPNDVQRMLFVTWFGKIAGVTIECYCETISRLFYADVLKTAEPVARGTHWFKRTMDSSSTICDFSTEACMKLNDIEAARQRLDELYEQLDVDFVSDMLRESKFLEENGSVSDPVVHDCTNLGIGLDGVANHTNGSNSFTIKVMHAENIQACDMNGFSDPYAVLSLTASQSPMRTGRISPFGSPKKSPKIANGPVNSAEHMNQNRLVPMTTRIIGRTRVIPETLNPRWEESFDCTFSGRGTLQVTVYDKDVVTSDDVAGSATVILEPKSFEDLLPKDVWLDLHPRGRMLLRIWVEGEKNDVQFHFGKAFRCIKRTRDDLVRIMIEQMSGYIQKCISRGSLFKEFKSKRPRSITAAGFYSGKSNNSGDPAVVTDEDCDRAIHPLIDFLERTLSSLHRHLCTELSDHVITKLWKEILNMVEGVLAPPLLSKPVDIRPLDEMELHLTLKVLELLKIYFNADGEGLPFHVLENAKYHELVQMRLLYDLSSHDLILCYSNLTAQSTTAIGVHQKNRFKSILAQRKRGATRRRQKNQRKSEPSFPTTSPLPPPLPSRPRALTSLSPVDSHARFPVKPVTVLQVLQMRTEKEARTFVVRELDARNDRGRREVSSMSELRAEE